MKRFIFPRYSTSGCRRPTQALSIRAWPSLCLPLQMQPENFLHFTPDMQWVLSRSRPGPRNFYNLSTNQAQALKAFAFPHLTLQFQDESLPEKPRCLRMCNSLTLAERTPRHKYVLGRNTCEETKVFPQGKASHWIPRTARKGKSQDVQKALKLEPLQHRWRQLSLQLQEKEAKRSAGELKHDLEETKNEIERANS